MEVIALWEDYIKLGQALKAAGLVESAMDFDRFLCQNGYDKTIRTGTYEISKNASYEDIAKKLKDEYEKMFGSEYIKNDLVIKYPNGRPYSPTQVTRQIGDLTEKHFGKRIHHIN